MTERTIMIFPEFSNRKVIDEIREKYDPLCHLVKPHITLVFPFKSDIPDAQLRTKLDESLQNARPFPLILQGISRQEDAYGNYIFLNVKTGVQELIQIHNDLYQNVFQKKYDDVYVPHMTIGNLDSADKMEEAYHSIKGMNECFETIAEKVSVERIGEHGESIIIIEKNL